MKKALFTLVTLAGLLVFTSARYDEPADSRVGHHAPQLPMTNAHGTMSLQQYRGQQYVILTFWTSSEPESRIANMRYDRAASRSERVAHMSVNLDRSEQLMEQLVKVDRLSKLSQFHCADDSRDQMVAKWRLDEQGPMSFLIDLEGNIVAVNPTVEQLEHI